MHNEDTIRIDIPSNLTSLSFLSAHVAEMLSEVNFLEEPGATLDMLQRAVQETCANSMLRSTTQCTNGHIVMTLTVDACAQRFIVELDDLILNTIGRLIPELENMHDIAYELSYD